MDSSSSSKTPFAGNSNIMLDLNQLPEEDHEALSDQVSQGEFRKVEPEWLERFFKKTLFAVCSEHNYGQKSRNKLDKYCIDCDASLCCYCISVAPHGDHRILKIYRHLQRGLVRFNVIEQHIDCSQIQPYRSNNHVVLALTPGLHSGSKTKDDETTCRTCKRKLIEYHLYSYCSIACKIEAFTKKAIYDSPPFLSLELLEPKVIQDSELKMVVALPATKQDSEKKTTAVYQLAQNVEIEPQMANLDQSAKKPKQEPETKMAVPEPSVCMANQEKNLSYRTRRRKGYPQRSPLF